MSNLRIILTRETATINNRNELIEEYHDFKEIGEKSIALPEFSAISSEFLKRTVENMLPVSHLASCNYKIQGDLLVTEVISDYKLEPATIEQLEKWRSGEMLLTSVRYSFLFSITLEKDVEPGVIKAHMFAGVK